MAGRLQRIFEDDYYSAVARHRPGFEGVLAAPASRHRDRLEARPGPRFTRASPNVAESIELSWSRPGFSGVGPSPRRRLKGAASGACPAPPPKRQHTLRTWGAVAVCCST